MAASKEMTKLYDDLLHSCAAAAAVSNRARARSPETNPPRNSRRADTTYPFRTCDMAWSSISRHRLHTDPPKGSQRRRPGLSTTRARSLERVMTNSPSQRGVALLKLKGHSV